MDAIIWTVKKKFSTVSNITCENLQEMIRCDENIVIYDTRELDEYNVSHLPSAIHVNPKISSEELQNEISKIGDNATTVVCYCSLGYRSSDIANKISHLTNKYQVYNLEGSIFKWANEDRELVSNEGPTKFVHPYSNIWGQTLDKDRWKWSL